MSFYYVRWCQCQVMLELDLVEAIVKGDFQQVVRLLGQKTDTDPIRVRSFLTLTLINNFLNNFFKFFLPSFFFRLVFFCMYTSTTCPNFVFLLALCYITHWNKKKKVRVHMAHHQNWTGLLAREIFKITNFL